jgi:hypothetical protein
VLEVLVPAVSVLALVAGLAYGVASARGQVPVQWHVWLAAVVEVVALAVAVVAVVGLAQGENAGSTGSLLLYVLAVVLVVPLAFLWAMAEPTRWGTAVLAGGALTLSILLVRLGQVFAGV